MPDKTPQQITGEDINRQPALLDAAKLKWRPSVYGLIVRGDDILVLDNTETQKHDLPGGGIDIWETMHAALHREIMEECGITIAIQHLVYHDEQFFLSPSGNHWHSLRFYYQVTMTGGTLRNTIIPDEKSVNPHWVSLMSLTSHTIPVAWGAIQQLQSQI